MSMRLVTYSPIGRGKGARLDRRDSRLRCNDKPFNASAKLWESPASNTSPFSSCCMTSASPGTFEATTGQAAACHKGRILVPHGRYDEDVERGDGVTQPCGWKPSAEFDPLVAVGQPAQPSGVVRKLVRSAVYAQVESAVPRECPDGANQHVGSFVLVKRADEADLKHPTTFASWFAPDAVDIDAVGNEGRPIHGKPFCRRRRSIKRVGTTRRSSLPTRSRRKLGRRTRAET